MRCLPPVLILAAALALAPGASAKGVLSAKVCGTDGCRTIANASDGLLFGGPFTDAPTRGRPFVRLRVVSGVPQQHATVVLLFVPETGVMRVAYDGSWIHADDPAPLRKAAAMVTPFPAAKLPIGDASAPRKKEAAPPPRPASDDGPGPWWLAFLVVPLGLAAALARHRRGRGHPIAT
jgi:hypothetical protein